MMTSGPSSNEPSTLATALAHHKPPAPKLSNKIPGFMLLVAFLGFMDAAYLTIEHFMGGVPECSILEGCEVVTTSQYSQIGPVPLALLGAIYYLTMIVLLVLWFDKRDNDILKWVIRLSVVGLLVSLYLVYLQLFVIDAICIYCMGSAITSTLLFISALVLKRRLKTIVGQG